MPLGPSNREFQLKTLSEQSLAVDGRVGTEELEVGEKLFDWVISPTLKTKFLEPVPQSIPRNPQALGRLRLIPA